MKLKLQVGPTKNSIKELEPILEELKRQHPDRNFCIDKYYIQYFTLKGRSREMVMLEKTKKFSIYLEEWD